MRIQDILIVGLAGIGIYYIAKRFIIDDKKRIANTIIQNPAEDNLITQSPPKVVTTIGTPTMDGEIDIVRWVEND